ncbi:MAG: tRNA glutamyl-Q(34) synthetase GluQRS [Dechloromonas sp.]|nr:tRNA glutamyl-Q(34) synthetase GluQRS [Dechloromonas sp.]
MAHSTARADVILVRVSSISSSPPCRGRFAPSPTGPLHFGSLVAALGSCLSARQQGGEWLLRIEDVDLPRTVSGAADGILRTLDAFGFAWDGPVLYQSQRLAAYAEVLAELKVAGLVYGCLCTRSEIARQSSRPAVDGGLLYPGTCRSGLPAGQRARAWRLRLDGTVSFVDAIQGAVCQCLPEAVGDVVLQRADGLYAYQLAVTVDDHFQGISEVVRGADLLASTPRQIALLRILGWPLPRYAHLPLVLNPAGEKWSKQTQAPALDVTRAVPTMVAALRFLGQAVPPELVEGSLAEVWRWALVHWRLAAVPRGGLPTVL